MVSAFERNAADPHGQQPVFTMGLAPSEADVTLVLIHGRGASAERMLSLYRELALPNAAAIAPQGHGGTWYPQSFLAPLEANQPYLDSALRRIDSVTLELMRHGVPSDKIAILGFSQGACLTLEFAARNPRRYRAIIGLTGGLIGPPGTPRSYKGSLNGTPVFLGSSDPDPHVPFERVLETKAVLERLGASVELRRYTGMPHTINGDELDACRTLLSEIGKQQLKG